ncbi:hypothetical protein ATANTOWER_009660 [Ataeniobius toweri]|uniref:Uncharacterized protein n=1 Tax=Ataeniobius toweri TaxID=208326 RepID=A0ABU7BNR8_9TELE|nr:hypothetical protein [Ataeniobius toweri]
MADQNRPEAVRKSFSMASPNSSHRPKRPNKTPSSACSGLFLLLLQKKKQSLELDYPGCSCEIQCSDLQDFLINLSSAKESSRQMMRKCRGLIDSLAAYIKDCVKEEKTDDESLENCVCILHNLTFQLEDEVPSLFTNINALAKPPTRSISQNNASPVGCFSSQTKPPQMEVSQTVSPDHNSVKTF